MSTLIINKKVAVVTIALPPKACGTGTYSWRITRHWVKTNRDVIYVVMNGAKASRYWHTGLQVEEFLGKANRLAELVMDADEVFLHYVGRGLHRWGCPWYLPIVLLNWKRAGRERRLAVMFHELWGHPPWHSKLRLSESLNRWTIGKLARLADVVVTNTEEHAIRLRELTKIQEIGLLPVGASFDPVGEVRFDFQERDCTTYVLFGLAYGRVQSLKAMGPWLRRLIDAGRLRKFVLVGPIDPKWEKEEQSLLTEWLSEAQVTSLGQLPEEKLSAVLATGGFFLLHQAAAGYRKSTRLMTFANHGCAVVVLEKTAEDPSCFFMTAEEILLSPNAVILEKASELARRLHGWFERTAGSKTIREQVDSLFSV